MPSDGYDNGYVYKRLLDQDEAMRKALRGFEPLMSPTMDAIMRNADPLITDFSRRMNSTFDALEEARRMAELSSGLATSRDLAADWAKIGSAEREFMEQAKKYRFPEMDILGRAARESMAYAHMLRSPEMDAFEQAAKDARDFADRFRVPEMGEVSRLLEGRTDPFERQYGLQASALERSLRAMNQPWLDIHDTLASVTGIAKLHGIGRLVASEPPFAASVAKTLRRDFGDWRDPITWTGDLARDVSVRAGLYVDRGFNSQLTSFPELTFDEGLESSGLQRSRPALVVAYGEPVPRSDDEDQEASFARNNLAHDWLQRFETQIRQFIDMAMTAAFGSDWPRHRLPNGLYDEWVAKRGKDKSGLARPLICYADFTDYERIICKQDNWKDVFARHFKRAELVRESLQRLYPSRVATMHAHPLLQGEELYVFVEVRRLVKLFLV